MGACLGEVVGGQQERGGWQEYVGRILGQDGGGEM